MLETMAEDLANKGTHEFELRLMNKDPKPDAKSYQIRTFKDMVNVCTVDNVEGFIKDFVMCLTTICMVRDSIDPEKLELLSESYTWIDDHKPKDK